MFPGGVCLKYCSYHQGFHPADDFVIVTKGRGGRQRVAMCRPCYEARKDPEAFKARLEQVVARNKERNKREFKFLFSKKN